MFVDDVELESLFSVSELLLLLAEVIIITRIDKTTTLIFYEHVITFGVKNKITFSLNQRVILKLILFR